MGVFDFGRRGRRTRHAYQHGDGVKIDSNVGVRDDDDPGGSTDLKGETGRILQAANNEWQSDETGEPMIAVQLDNGGIVGVPKAALRPMNKSR